MDTEKLNVIFEGRLTGDLPLEQVKANLAAMFKMNGSQVESLFSGKPIAIKRNVDKQLANKYVTALQKAGAICKIISAEQTNTAAPPQNTQVKEKTPAQQPSSGTQQGASARNYGRDIVNLAVPADLSGLNMAEAGEILVESVEIQPEIPDTSGLSFSTDEKPLAPPTTTPEPKLDISGFSIEPAE